MTIKNKFTPEMVPEAAVMKAALERWGVNQPTKWEKDTCRIIIAAGLSAWPGVKLENLCGWVMDGPDLPYVEETASIILPLMEPRDGE